MQPNNQNIEVNNTRERLYTSLTQAMSPHLSKRSPSLKLKALA